MDLRGQNRLASPDCFVCRWQGRHIVLWPQQMVEYPKHDNTGTWYGYINVHEVIYVNRSQRMKSRHGRWEACHEHFKLLHQDWVQVASDEVRLDYIFNQGRERMEQ